MLIHANKKSTDFSDVNFGDNLSWSSCAGPISALESNGLLSRLESTSLLLSIVDVDSDGIVSFNYHCRNIIAVGVELVIIWDLCALLLSSAAKILIT